MKKRKKILFISTLFSSVLSILYIINKLIYFLNSTYNKGYQKNNFYYEWRFGKIRYNIYGKGKPLLLIHSMYNGASSEEYNKLITELSKKRKVYLIDLLGYGKSDKPNITYTAYLYMQMIFDFIKYVIKEPVDIITSGESNAFVSMLYLQDSSFINKLIFINPVDVTNYSKNPSNMDKLFKYMIEIPIIGSFIYNIFSSKAILKRQLKTYFYNINTISIDLLNNFYYNTHNKYSLSRYPFASHYTKYNNVNIEHALRSISHSTLIIQGAEVDRDIEKIYTNYKKLNPSIEYVIINKTKEFPHIENTEKTLKNLNMFL